jgi:hypothetical protein
MYNTKSSFLSGQNIVLYVALTLFLGFYGPRLQPRLPQPVYDIISSPVVRVAVIFIIMYLATHHMAIAIISLLIFMLIVQLVQNNMILSEAFENKQKEHFAVTINGPPVAACDSLTQPTLQMYPLNDSKQLATMRGPATLAETLDGAF